MQTIVRDGISECVQSLQSRLSLAHGSGTISATPHFERSIGIGKHPELRAPRHALRVYKFDVWWQRIWQDLRGLVTHRGKLPQKLIV
jgi:hypothetical protein